MYSKLPKIQSPYCTRLGCVRGLYTQLLDAGYASSSLLAGGGASERGCLPMDGRTGRGRLAMARFRPDVFPGGNPWQFSRFMHPRRGLGQEKAPLPGNISPPCIQNELVLARYARHVSEKPRKPLLEDASREYLARKGPFSLPRSLESCTARESCQGAPTARTPRIMHTAQILPSVAAEQRERSQARRCPYGAAACLGTAEQGAGGSLSGGVGRC